MRRRSQHEEMNEIEEMDTGLINKYHLKTVEDLYSCIRWADFHITGKDIDEHWNIAAYAAFSGIVLPYRLSSNELRSLHAEFQCQKDLHRSAWATTVAEEMAAGQVVHRDRDHVAIAHRYACAKAGQYFPPPRNRHIMPDLAELDRSSGQR